MGYHKLDTARDYRDLLCHIIDWAITNPTLIDMDREWELLRGQRNPVARGYFDGNLYIPDSHTLGLQYDPAVAFGMEDTSWDDALHRVGWMDYINNSSAHIGFEAESTAQPYSYEIVAMSWSGADANSQARQLLSWRIEGSDDLSSWTIIDTQTGVSAWSSGESRTYAIDQTTTPHIYKYWRLVATGNHGDTTYIGLGRLRFKDSVGEVLSNAYSPEVILKGAGYGGTDLIYFGVELIEDRTDNYYNFRLSCFLDYDPSSQITGQYKVQSTYTTLWEFSIPYFLRVTPWGITCAPKISTISELFGVSGFYKYYTNQQWPYYWLLFGSGYSATERWSSTSGYHSTLQMPASYSSANQASRQTCFLCMPDHEWGGLGSSMTDDNIMVTPSSRPREIYPLEDGSFLLEPYTLVTSTGAGGGAVLGDVDGMYWVTGNSNAFENVITDSEDNSHYVIKNLWRSGWKDYACLRMD